MVMDEPGPHNGVTTASRIRRRRWGAVLFVAAAISCGSLTAWALTPGAPARHGHPLPPTTVTIVPEGNIVNTFSFLLVVRTAGSGTQTVPFSATGARDMPPSGPVVIGSADAAGDGHPEIFVLVDRGCCSDFWTVFRSVNGHFQQVSIAGTPVRLAVGGTVMHNAGFSCNGPGHDLVTFGYGPAAAKDTFLVARDTYRWAAATLVLVSHRSQIIHATPSSPALARYSGVSCGALNPDRGHL